MQAKIITMPMCSKCRSLKDACPDTECIELDQAEILEFARKVGIRSMPFVILIGEPGELTQVVKGIQ